MRSIVVSSLLASLMLLTPQNADACGGTFCDGGPNAMPVDQSGENILFSFDGDTVEVHIQIQYQGDPDKFAWIIPVTAVPEFSVGSELLFQNLLQATVPIYGFNTQTDVCPMVDQSFDSGGGNGTSPASGLTGGDSGGDDGGGPDVVFQETVGAYDIVVLEGGTAQEVMDWLGTNGYQQDPNALPILEEYLAEGQLFAAFKLTGGAGVDQIHPVTLRYQGNEPCVPIRLTRIAAVEDMEIRAFFLGNHRAAPTNYKHVLVNPLKIDWLALASNYKEVITLAVDTADVDGKAFVTEYAGPTDVVQQFGLFDTAWSSTPFATIDPVAVVDTLSSQGLMGCYEDYEGSTCFYNHTLLQPLLIEFLPPPVGVDPGDFYACLTCFADMIDLEAWDGVAFGAALKERIIDPGKHAVDLLAKWPYVTRMYTTISPAEMTADPIFHENPDLQPVVALRMGTRRNLCNGDSVFYLPDDRQVYLPAGATWPAFQDEMPWVEEVDMMPLKGAPMVLALKTDEIDELLAEYNAKHGWPSESCACHAHAPPSPSATPGWLALAAFLAFGGGMSWVRRHRV